MLSRGPISGAPISGAGDDANRASATLTAEVNVSATGHVEAGNTVTLPAGAGLSATGGIISDDQASLGAEAGLAADASVAKLSVGTLPAEAGLSAAGGVDAVNAVTLPAQADIAATAQTEAQNTVTLPAEADISAKAGLVRDEAVTLPAEAGLTAKSQLVFDDTVSLDAEAGIAADSDIVKLSTAEIDAEAGLSAEGDLYIAPAADEDRVYLVDISAVDENEDPQTLRFSSGYGYTSRGDDTPAWGSWVPGLKVTGNIECNLFAPGATQGYAATGFGEIRIANVDGAFDHLLDWAFDGRTVTIRRLPNERAPLTEAVTVFTGAIQDATFDSTGIAWTVRDRLDILRVPIQTARYAGTTTSAVAGGIEGNADVEGQIKPLAFGVCLNVSPVAVNIYELIYQISTNPLASIDAVYDRGQPLTWDMNDYVDADALELADVDEGAYTTCLAEGLIKLGSTPDGLVTCDVTEGGGSPTTDTAAQIVRRILENYAGLTSVDLLTATFDNLDTLNPAIVGTYITDERDVLDACSQILQALDATLAVDRLGRFGVYRIDLPEDTDTPAFAFTDDDVLGDDIELVPAQDGNAGIPPWEIVLNYRRNWTVQGDDELAGAVLECADAERRQFLRESWRKVTASDVAVLARHKLSKPAQYDSLIVDKSDAEAEATRRFALRQTKRPIIQFTVPADRADTINRTDVVSLTYDRYGNDTGKLYRVLGTVYDFDSERITLSVWGGVDPA